jgi:hypothetical protein
MGDQEQDKSELPDEIFGALWLKRKVGGTGFMYVTGPKRFSKKNPYQARVKNKRTGKTQNLGMSTHHRMLQPLLWQRCLVVGTTNKWSTRGSIASEVCNALHPPLPCLMPLHTLLACCTCASAGCARCRLPQLSRPMAWITSSGSLGSELCL